MLKRITATLLILGLGPATYAQQQDCESLLRDAFNTSIRMDGASNSSQFKSWQCSFNSKTHNDALGIGLNVGTVVFDVPLEVGGNFNQSEIETWKSQNCSQEQRANDAQTASFTFVRTFVPEMAALVAKCLDIKARTTRAVDCRMEGTDKTPVFVAEWRRTYGDAVAPTVRRFNVVGGTCEASFPKDELIQEGGNLATCKANDGQDFIVALETSRGSCFQTKTWKPVTETLSGLISLTSDRTITSEIIDIRPDAKIVTNGHALTLDALKEIRIAGNPSIISYDPAVPAPGRGLNGRSPSPIVIQSRLVSGGQLNLSNFGEDGDKGSGGTRGPTGRHGRGHRWNPWKGCHDRRHGEKGGTGLIGGPGGNGGSAGPVVINVRDGLQMGAVSRISIATRQQLTDGSTRQCKGSCGGRPGPGGNGGPGGYGGSGASSAQGCGGADPGPIGDPGPSGQSGAFGQDLQPTVTQ